MRRPVVGVAAAVAVFGLIAAGAATFSVSDAGGGAAGISPIMSGSVSYDIDPACPDSFTVDFDTSADQRQITGVTVADVTTMAACTGAVLPLTGNRVVYDSGEGVGTLAGGSVTGVVVGDWVQLDAKDNAWDGVYEVSEVAPTVKALAFGNTGAGVDLSEVTAAVALRPAYQLTVDTYGVVGGTRTWIAALSRPATDLVVPQVVIDPPDDVDITTYESLQVVVKVAHL